MEKNTSTILIAFLTGVIVAGGVAYVVSETHNRPVEQVAANTSKPAQPAASAPAPAETATSQPALPEPSAQTPPPQESEAPPVTKPSPRPTPAHKVRVDPDSVRPGKSQTEGDAAPQPTEAEVPPAPPAAPEPVPQPAAKDSLQPPPNTVTAPPPPRAPRTVTLQSGTPITVRINEELSSEKNTNGDSFSASLEQPIILEGAVIADKGARVLGSVTRAERAGRVKGTSLLQLELTQIHTTDGQNIVIETAPWVKEGQTSKKSDTAKIAGGAALGAIIGAIAGGGKGAAIGAGTGGGAGAGAVLLTRGKDAKIPAETSVTFALSENVKITERLN